MGETLKYSALHWSNVFKPNLSIQIIVDDDGERVWTLYDAGPKAVRSPIMFLPPASGKADVFFKQIIVLSTAGYRVVAVSILFNCKNG